MTRIFRPLDHWPAVAESIQSRAERSPPQGREVRLPFLFGGVSPLSVTPIPAGLGLRSFPFDATTPPIPFAAYQLVGIDTTIGLSRGTRPSSPAPGSGLPGQDVLIDVLLNDVRVDGEIPVLYAPQSVRFAGQRGTGPDANVGGPGLWHPQGETRTIPGLRANTMVQPNQTISLLGVLRQEITTQFQNVVELQFAAVLRVIWDQQIATIGEGR